MRARRSVRSSQSFLSAVSSSATYIELCWVWGLGEVATRQRAAGIQSLALRFGTVSCCDEVCGLGDMGCVIADSFDILCAKQQVDEPDGLRGVDAQLTDEILENFCIECIDLLVLLAHDQRLFSVTRDKRV